MPRKTGKRAPESVRASRDYSGPIDAFARVAGETMRKFDRLADAQGRTRSNLIAFIIHQYVEQEYPKLADRRGR